MVIHSLLAATLMMTSLPAADVQAKADCAKVKCLALTFDDGPSDHTATLLKVLRKEQAKATFFLVGKQVERRPAVAKSEAAQGHAIGNHTYSHPSLPSKLDNDVIDEIKSTQALIEQATGQRPKMFRPPYGHTDERVLGLAGQQDLAQVLWSGTTLDWKLRDVKQIKAAVLRLAKRDGVILMHDTVPQTVQAMPEIIKELKKQGYRLVTVPALLRGKALTPGVSYP
ncbi:polysaccharide deacetylase family protein [Nonomuraea sp. NPDC000554]|uniref:polysaccharide deacetylase family protein n=1 Tax=Nonomuraea sp. NPDC000554 TaxID=3154259 RepID=UPI00332307DA